MSAASILDSRTSWMRLTLTLVIAIVGNAGMWSAIVVLPDMQAEFGLGRADSSLPYTLFMLGFAVGSFGMGKLVDKLGVTRAIWISSVVTIVAFTLASLSPIYWIVALLHAVLGFATATFFGPLMADISLWFFRRRGIAVAIAASGNYLAGAIWPILLSDVIAEQGWRGAYLALAAITLVVILPLSVFLRQQVPAEAIATADARASARASAVSISPRLLTGLLIVAALGCCVAMSMPQVHIVAYCVDLGYGPAVGAEMLSVMLLGGVISRLISGLIADKLGGVVTLLIGSTLQCIALFLYLPFDGLVPLYMVSAVFGLSQGGIVPAYALVVREYMPAREAGARVGLVIAATMVGMALGGWMSGWIYDLTRSYQAAFLNGIAWNILNVAIMLLILFRAKSRALPNPA